MPEPQDLFLAIDQGGQSTRVAIYTAGGQQLCCFSAKCTTRVPESPAGQEGAYVEQDGEEILAGIRRCLAEVKDFLGDQCRWIKAAGFSGQGSSLLCWSKSTGKPLSPVLSWQDRRAESMLEHFPLTQTQVQARTGLRLSPHYGASKMRWCLDNLSDVKAAYKNHDLYIGPIVSYLFWNLLTGPLPNQTPQEKTSLVDPGHGQRTLLWNLYRNQWDQELLSAFQIPENILPKCVWHNSQFGHLSVNDYPIPVSSCARDQGASLFARGVPVHGAYYINIGTGAFLQCVTGQLTAPPGLLVSPLWLTEDSQALTSSKLYAWEATVNGAAAAIPWLENILNEKLDPARIDAALMSDNHSPTSNNIFFFLNAVGGLSAPYWRTDLHSQFSHPELSSTEKIQAWIESILFQLIVNIDLMKIADVAPRIFISGGLSRAQGLCQRLADLSGFQVCRSDNVDASLQGIAFTAAGMPKGWNPLQKDDVFNPQENQALHERFAHWQRAMDDWLLGK